MPFLEPWLNRWGSSWVSGHCSSWLPRWWWVVSVDFGWTCAYTCAHSGHLSSHFNYGKSRWSSLRCGSSSSGLKCRDVIGCLLSVMLLPPIHLHRLLSLIIIIVIFHVRLNVQVPDTPSKAGQSKDNDNDNDNAHATEKDGMFTCLRIRNALRWTNDRSQSPQKWQTVSKKRVCN